MDAWKKVDDLGDDIPDAIRKDPDVLQKISDFDAETRGRFDELGDEFKNVPDQHKKGWVDHLEKRTVDGKVSQAGGNTDKYGTYNSKADVPERYSSKQDFDDLSYDPATKQTSPKTRQEAMAGLEAESQGILDGPISRDPSGNMEFFDSNGSPWDVKGPGGGDFFNVNQVGPSIRKELRDKGPFPNNNTGVAEPRQVILDTTYIDDTELGNLRSWMQNNLTPEELGRVKEVNSNLL
ncbi:MAG: hypothetical protein AAFX87_31660 [Bacteroidota bacterium]